MNSATGGNIIFKFLGDDSSLKKTTQSIGGMTKSILYATGITKALSAGWNMLTGSMDQAISRYDTLNQFPKVMSNLGIASEEADKAIEKMSKGLEGLPTTLDEGARAVQRFTSKNEDVGKSTDMFLALNNAILAGGASSEIQASALEQLSQAYAKGKPDMMEWRTAMTAMPAQLKQVAKAMGYVDADQLGQDLREGAVSMDEFMDAIMRLNEEGVDGLANFRDQAKAGTQGIATSIKNAKTQVVKGVADIIDALNFSLGKTNLGTLPDLIGNVGKKSKQALDVVADVIRGEISLMDFGKSITDMVSKMTERITENFPMVFNKAVDMVLEFTKGLTNEESVQNLISSASTMMETIIDTITNRLPDVLVAGTEIITNVITGISNELPNLDTKMLNVANKILEAVNNDEFIDKLYQAAGKILVALAVGMIKAIPQVIQGIGQLKAKMQEEILHLPEKWFRVGVDIIIGLWEGIKSQIGSFGKNFQDAIDGVVVKIKKKLKIASPSKVFRFDIGEMMGEGLGIGFVDSLKGIQNDIQRAINDTFGIGVNPELENSLHYSPNVIVNNNIEANTDPLGQMVMKVKTFANGAKNDYNYGMGV